MRSEKGVGKGKWREEKVKGGKIPLLLRGGGRIRIRKNGEARTSLVMLLILFIELLKDYSLWQGST